MAFDSLLQRRIMGHFATGVTIITTRCEERVWGMTANAVLSLSLDPPRILIAVNRQTPMHDCLLRGQCFAVNVLTRQQEVLARRFATRGPKDFVGVPITVSETGAPVLTEALAFVDCRVVEVLDGGDHEIFIGEPIAGQVREGHPLIFYSGQYAHLAHLTHPNATIEYTLEDTFDHYGTF